MDFVDSGPRQNPSANEELAGSCRVSVQIRFGSWIALGMRCSMADEIVTPVDTVIQPPPSVDGRPKDVFYNPVKRAGQADTSIGQYNIQRWNSNGKYELPASDAQAMKDNDLVFTFDNFAICKMINGQVFCLTQVVDPKVRKGTGCPAAWQPATSGQIGKQQHWRFVPMKDDAYDMIQPVCFSRDYQVQGGEKFDRLLNAMCTTPIKTPRAVSLAEPGSDDPDACHLLAYCLVTDGFMVVLGTTDNPKYPSASGCPSSYKNNLFFVTPVPALAGIMYSCGSNTRTLSLREALSNYHMTGLYNTGCQARPFQECLFASYSPC